MTNFLKKIKENLFLVAVVADVYTASDNGLEFHPQQRLIYSGNAADYAHYFHTDRADGCMGISPIFT